VETGHFSDAFSSLHLQRLRLQNSGPTVAIMFGSLPEMKHLILDKVVGDIFGMTCPQLEILQLTARSSSLNMDFPLLRALQIGQFAFSDALPFSAPLLREISCLSVDKEKPKNCGRTSFPSLQAIAVLPGNMGCCQFPSYNPDVPFDPSHPIQLTVGHDTSATEINSLKEALGSQCMIMRA